MKAIVFEKYGPPDVLELKEIEIPRPKENQVLIKIYAASLNAYDWHMLTAQPFLVRTMGGGFLRPKNPFLGADIAGRIEALGSAVEQFKVGDEVYGDIGYGGFAEYASARENKLGLKPNNLSFEEAAAVPMAGMTALQGLRDKGGLQPGQRVLIYGASGGVGTFAVQIAKVLGAEVTAVCSTAKLEQARTLGADQVIDYTREDFSRNGKQYDLILGVNGHRPLSAYKRALAPQGCYVMAGGKNAQIFGAMLFGPLMSQRGGKQLGGVSATISQKDLITLKEWLEAGKIRPVIDRRYPLAETAEALRYVYAGHASGKVVIQVV